MVVLKSIREDLREIRYYFGHKEKFDEAAKDVGTIHIVELAKKYNEIICSADTKIYETYIELYVQNQTQEEYARRAGYSQEYIQVLNKRLLLHIQKQLNEKKET